MKRASYRDAIDFIAYNDGPGDADALDAEIVGGLTTSVLVGQIFGVYADKVGRDVVRYRRKHDICDDLGDLS